MFSFADPQDRPRRQGLRRLPLHPSIPAANAHSIGEAWADGGKGQVKNDRRFPAEYLKPLGQFNHYMQPLIRNPILDNMGVALPATCEYPRVRSVNTQLQHT